MEILGFGLFKVGILRIEADTLGLGNFKEGNFKVWIFLTAETKIKIVRQQIFKVEILRIGNVRIPDYSEPNYQILLFWELKISKFSRIYVQKLTIRNCNTLTAWCFQFWNFCSVKSQHFNPSAHQLINVRSAKHSGSICLNNK